MIKVWEKRAHLTLVHLTLTLIMTTSTYTELNALDILDIAIEQDDYHTMLMIYLTEELPGMSPEAVDNLIDQVMSQSTKDGVFNSTLADMWIEGFLSYSMNK